MCGPPCLLPQLHSITYLCVLKCVRNVHILMYIIHKLAPEMFVGSTYVL